MGPLGMALEEAEVSVGRLVLYGGHHQRLVVTGRRSHAGRAFTTVVTIRLPSPSGVARGFGMYSVPVNARQRSHFHHVCPGTARVVLRMTAVQCTGRMRGAFAQRILWLLPHLRFL
jgi:hypothetical protein